MWYDRENSKGLLETLDSKGKKLEAGKKYIYNGKLVRIANEWVCEGGMANEPFTAIFYEIDGRMEKIFFDCEWEETHGRKLPYYPSPFIKATRGLAPLMQGWFRQTSWLKPVFGSRKKLLELIGSRTI